MTTNTPYLENLRSVIQIFRTSASAGLSSIFVGTPFICVFNCKGASLLRGSFISRTPLVQRWSRISLGSEPRKVKKLYTLQVNKFMYFHAKHKRPCDLSSNNQSLILMEVRTEDSGKFTCIARDEFGHSISHTTRWI